MGGSPKVEQPQVPAAPTATSNMKDYVENYPKLFELMKQYAPQEAQLNLDLANQYTLPMAEAYKTAQEAMYPEETKISNMLNQQIQEGMGSNVPGWMREQYQSNLNANLGNNAGSGVGADYMSRGLLQQNKDWQDYYRNLGLSVIGRQPIATAQQPQYTNQLGGYTANGVASANNQAYGSYVNAYSNMYGTNAGLASQGNPWMNAGMGIVGMGVGGFMGNPGMFASGATQTATSFV